MPVRWLRKFCICHEINLNKDLFRPSAPWENLGAGGRCFSCRPSRGLFGIRFLFCRGFIAFHHLPNPPAPFEGGNPPSLRDLGCGTEEPRRGERILGRWWSMAEPLPENGKNPTIKNVAVSVILFIFAVRNQQKYKCVHVQSISMTV